MENLTAERRVASTELFVASKRLTFLDQYRTPYGVERTLAEDGLHQLRRRDGGPALLWPAAPGATEPASAWLPSRDERPSIPLCTRVLPASRSRRLLERHGGRWSPRDVVAAGADGTQIASIWRGEDGSVFLPFDPDEALLNLWSERYGSVGRGALPRHIKRRLVRGYYRARPLLPRAGQIWLRRRIARIQARSRFPRWPVEPGLHDFTDLLFELLAEVTGDAVPRIAPWPVGHSWALVLTHDVEHAAGYASIAPIAELERTHKIRSSWNFVPRRYEVAIEHVRELTDDGFEIGVHGLYHDGRDLESLRTMMERLPGIRDAAERWGAVGFRSPATHRRWEWMPLLGFDYDSSYPDSDPFEPMAGGCCSWLPFFNQGMVELPLTLPQDHTLFVILGHHDERAWVEKTELLRARGGMALIDTHPDYLVETRIRRAYARFLESYAGNEHAWIALPREVSEWWRRRHASHVERHDGRWTVAGPAAGEAAVECVSCPT